MIVTRIRAAKGNALNVDGFTLTGVFIAKAARGGGAELITSYQTRKACTRGVKGSCGSAIIGFI